VKDDRLYLHHMLERCHRITRFIRPGRETFIASEELQDAVIRNVEVIGEAAKRVSPESRDRMPSLEDGYHVIIPMSRKYKPGPIPLLHDNLPVGSVTIDPGGKMIDQQELAICKRRGHDLGLGLKLGWRQCKWCALGSAKSAQSRSERTRRPRTSKVRWGPLKGSIRSPARRVGK
jgi:hypothetical protein